MKPRGPVGRLGGLAYWLLNLTSCDRVSYTRGLIKDVYITVKADKEAAKAV